jgi:hypothetical protein
MRLCTAVSGVRAARQPVVRSSHRRIPRSQAAQDGHRGPPRTQRRLPRVYTRARSRATWDATGGWRGRLAVPGAPQASGQLGEPPQRIDVGWNRELVEMLSVAGEQTNIEPIPTEVESSAQHVKRGPLGARLVDTAERLTDGGPSSWQSRARARAAGDGASAYGQWSRRARTPARQPVA